MYGGGPTTAASGGAPVGNVASASPIPQQWWDQDAAAAASQPQQPPQGAGSANNNLRSVTPAMANTRGSGVGPTGGGGGVRGASPGPGARDYYRPGGTGGGLAAEAMQQSQQPPPPYGAAGGSGGATYGGAGHGGAAGGQAPPSSSGDAMGQSQQQQSRGPSSTGLIRLTLRKPMGIVFEPMSDPHNPSQQRGVRICDLPRTGAAALSRKLEVGDELLSINDKTMSRLTFDEIMDFIIEADPERVNLLFRRPKKEALAMSKKGDGGVAVGVGGSGSGDRPGIGGAPSNSVKWIDDGADAKGGKKDKRSSRSDRGSKDKDRGREGSDRRGGGRSSSGRDRRRDESPSVYSGDESSRYTLDTAQDNGRRSRNQSGRGDGGGGGGRHRSKGKKGGMYESEGFLDMLIDTICAPLAQSDGVCRDRTKDPENSRRGGYGGGHRRRGSEDYYSDDDTFNSADDSTYVTYDSASLTEAKSDHRRGGGGRTSGSAKGKASSGRRGRDGQSRDDDESYMSDDDEETATLDDDGTATLDEEPVGKRGAAKSSRDKALSGTSGRKNVKDAAAAAPTHKTKSSTAGSRRSSSRSRPEDDRPYEDDATLETIETKEAAEKAAANAAAAGGSVASPLGLAPPDAPKQKAKVDPPTAADRATKGTDGKDEPSAFPTVSSNVPISELEYDDRFDHGADVSVMESLGGPSLFIETQRHENAAAAGAAAAANATGGSAAAGGADGLTTPSSLSELVAKYGKGYPPSPGMTVEETVRRDPHKFYRHVVKGLLEENEPEKVRLLDKLLAKYRGREAHLIQKLSVRYNQQKDGVGDTPTIQEEDEGGDSKLGSFVTGVDPKSRANVAAIETAKKRIKEGLSPSSAAAKERSKPKQDEEGWPAPIGETDDQEEAKPRRGDGGAPGETDDGPRSDDDSGASYSTGSEYSGESIDGTSPAVIAQVSELLNYVYGKTSVPGQIDRVSTIMRAYEGREAVLLELLETKALIKANAENEAANNLPASLRNSPALAASRQLQARDDDSGAAGDVPEGGAAAAGGDGNGAQRQESAHMSPVSGLTAPTLNTNTASNTVISKGGAETSTGELSSPNVTKDDISSISDGDEFNTKASSNPTSVATTPRSIKTDVAVDDKPVPVVVNKKASINGQAATPIKGTGAKAGNVKVATSSPQQKVTPQKSTKTPTRVPASGPGSKYETPSKKKKKGVFGLFRGKKDKKGKGDSGGAFPSGSPPTKNAAGKMTMLTPKGSKKGVLLNRVPSTEGSI